MGGLRLFGTILLREKIVFYTVRFTAALNLKSMSSFIDANLTEHLIDAMVQLLITGGAGFIGSHICILLLQAGHHLVMLDDFSNSSPIALERVGELAGGEAAARLSLVQGDIRNRTSSIRHLSATLHLWMPSSIAQD